MIQYQWMFFWKTSSILNDWSEETSWEKTFLFSRERHNDRKGIEAWEDPWNLL